MTIGPTIGVNRIPLLAAHATGTESCPTAEVLLLLLDVELLDELLNRAQVLRAVGPDDERIRHRIDDHAKARGRRLGIALGLIGGEAPEAVRPFARAVEEALQDLRHLG